jgi:hypothetical protein
MGKGDQIRKIDPLLSSNYSLDLAKLAVKIGSEPTLLV